MLPRTSFKDREGQQHGLEMTHSEGQNREMLTTQFVRQNSAQPTKQTELNGISKGVSFSLLFRDVMMDDDISLDSSLSLGSLGVLLSNMHVYRVNWLFLSKRLSPTCAQHSTLRTATQIYYK